MGITSLMVFPSLTFRIGVNRWLDITAPILSWIVLAATFLAGSLSARCVYQAFLQAVLLVLILVTAWRWPMQELLDLAPWPTSIVGIHYQVN
jgi:hypothetical protein